MNVKRESKIEPNLKVQSENSKKLYLHTCFLLCFLSLTMLGCHVFCSNWKYVYSKIKNPFHLFRLGAINNLDQSIWSTYEAKIKFVLMKYINMNVYSSSIFHRVLKIFRLMTYYYIDTSVLLENNQWRIFHILASEDIDDAIYRI